MQLPVKATKEATSEPAKYDVDVTLETSYRRVTAEGLRTSSTETDQSTAQQRPKSDRVVDITLPMARRKLVDALRSSPGITDVRDLPSVNHSIDSVAMNTFAPIFFAYNHSSSGQSSGEGEGMTQASKSYFVYNGRFLLVAAFCGKYGEIPALTDIVSEVCLLMSKSGFEFRWLPPTPTRQSLDAGIVSTALSTTSVALNDSVGGPGTMTRVFMSKPMTVQEVLRSLYAASFHYLSSFYSLKEQSNLKDALIQTIEAHAETVRGLIDEYGKTKWSQFLRRRRLRGLVRYHCSKLNEKVGRLGTVSDTLTKGIDSLDRDLQDEPILKAMLEREPSWKSYLQHDFYAKPTLDLVAFATDAIKGNRMRSIIILVGVLAAIAGGIVGFFIGRFV